MKRLWVIFALLMMSGCQTLGYVGQAALGHARLMASREPIPEILASPTLDPQLAQQLQVVSQAREFAEANLFLPANGSFTSYVSLDQPFPVWNVFAAPRYSLTPLSWCFPVAGCVSYRGYFSQEAATGFAGQLASDGYDVFVAGAEAYSTLGWFNDPLTSAVLWRDNNQLRALVFHELVHQHYYLPGDTAFNESLASFIEQQGLYRWHEARGEPSAMTQYQAQEQRQREFIDFVLGYRNRFAEMYASDAPSAARKQALQTEMREEWLGRGESAGYQGFFAGPLNNAQLSTVGSYFDWVPAFEQLLAEESGSLRRFYARVEHLMRLPDDKRRQALNELMQLKAD
ncbi:aminopeptidase [Pseudohongiella nitratireducens]|uniref:Aminopeptidase n=1 Tax=Pseudohongiella nitratireducens TaxID=1768907 RepID=A0A917GMS6_9GAMM|nr:aminopeptidase [Pseudohongiella nitratireducens]GGG52048.1 aminopeptidase [Pseudohongiella nitratireducens]